MLAFVFAVTSVPAIIGGVALLLKQAWAKTLIQILGFLNLINIPLGTIVGVYTIWVLMNDEAEEELNAEAS